jgi:hypothetical protein
MGNERRRRITLHFFRRFVKTTISDLGYADYCEYFIGHSGSRYWLKRDLAKVMLHYIIILLLSTTGMASALSIYAHVTNIPREGAQIGYYIVDLTRNQKYIANRSFTYNNADAEMALPDSFKVGDLVILGAQELFPYKIGYVNPMQTKLMLAEPGFDFWLPASPGPDWKAEQGVYYYRLS